MSAATLPRARGEASRTGADKVHHYVRTADVARSIVTGDKVTALCGETFAVGASAHNGTGNAPRVCQACTDLIGLVPVR